MTQRAILLFAAVGLVSINNCVAFVGDLKPYPDLWTTTDGIAMEAVCYPNPKSVQVTEPEFAAVIRVYVSNHRDRAVRRIGATDWDGFILEGKMSDGKAFSLPPVSRTMSHTRWDLTRGEMQSFTIALGRDDAAFLKNSSLTVVGTFFDPTQKAASIREVKFSIVRTPLHFKDVP
jgi:hypothetical protein